MNKAMQCKHINDDHVVELAAKWHADPIANDGVVGALVAEGWPCKLAETKVLRLVDRGLLDYGTSPYCAWPTEKANVAEQPTRDFVGAIAALTALVLEDLAQR